MLEAELHQKMNDKSIDKALIANEVGSQPELLPLVIKGLAHNRANIKYGCAKVLLLLSETTPALLYPHIDFFIGMLDSDKTILQWNAILIIANLARVDSQYKIEQIFDRYFAPISGPVMITANNTIIGGGRIAATRPELADRIIDKILQVNTAQYQSDECRYIASGEAILAFERCYEYINDKERVIQFVQEQLDNPRKGTAQKAVAFLKKHKLLFYAEK